MLGKLLCYLGLHRMRNLNPQPFYVHNESRITERCTRCGKLLHYTFQRPEY
jgi:hypothetical protein